VGYVVRGSRGEIRVEADKIRVRRDEEASCRVFFPQEKFIKHTRRGTRSEFQQLSHGREWTGYDKVSSLMTVMAGSTSSNLKAKQKESNMSLLNPMTWDLDFFLLRADNAPSTKQMRKERVVLAGVYLATFTLSAFWLAQVTKYVPEPYLVISLSSSINLRRRSIIKRLTPLQDEVFHIPQAQAYCRGEFNVWDPKLTTPPGL
jgi:DIE2/ALG10 family